MITLQDNKAKRILDDVLSAAEVALGCINGLVIDYTNGEINENRVRRAGRPLIARADRLRGRAYRIKEAYLHRMDIPQHEKDDFEARYDKVFDKIDWAVRFIG
jgi:hypothetical protein